jgi:mannose-6-phosphate isomerase
MSYVELPNGDSIALKDYIEQNPEGVLGHYGVEQYQGKLPFLFKILAIAAPLSIQCHPTKEQAEMGFSHEESLHIPVDPK